MSTRLVLVLGGGVGLLVCAAVLALLWFGVAGVLRIGNTDLMYVFWPSSLLLVVGWARFPAIFLTAALVLINCALYMCLAYGVRVAALFVARSWR